MGIPVSITAPKKLPIVTLTLIIVNILVFITMYLKPSLLVPGSHSVLEVQRSLALVPIAIIRGEKLWTLFTSMFLHADILHLLGNMLFLFVFGGPVESAMGRKNFIIFYFLSGLSATLFHVLSISFIPSKYLFTGTVLNPWVTPTLGASGAISGVMGAYLVYYPKTRITLIYPIWIIPLFLVLPAWVYVLIWFIYQLLMGLVSFLGLITTIAYWAHVGGFITGFALAPIFLDPSLKAWLRMRRELQERISKLYEDLTSYYYDEEFF